MPWLAETQLADRSVVERVRIRFGGAYTLTAPLGADGGLVPSALVAVTVNTYVSPPVSPVTVIGELGPVAVTGGAAGLVLSVAVTV